MLYDTGSEVSIINERIIRHLKVEMFDKNTKLFGIVSGHSLKVYGFIYLLVRLNEERKGKIIKFYVTPHANLGVLLGNNFGFELSAATKWLPNKRFHCVFFEMAKSKSGKVECIQMRAASHKQLIHVKEKHYKYTGQWLRPIKVYTYLDLIYA